MKTILKSLAVMACIFAAVPRLYSQGYIVPNGVGFFLDGIGRYGVGVIHDPTNGYTTGFDLIADGKTPPTTTYTNTYKFSPIVDVGVRVFLVSSNDSISLQPILANSYTELMFPNSYVFEHGVPFYLGLYTGNDQFAPPSGIYEDPLFGWAKLVNNRGVLEMLDSALVYQAQGIFAGTQNFVPEPSGFALTTLGALLSGCRWRRIAKS